MEKCAIEIISMLLFNSVDLADKIKSVNDLTNKMDIVYEELPNNVVFKDGKLYLNKNVTVKEKKVIMSFLKGTNPLINLINELTEIIPSVNILDFISVEEKLPNLFNFKYSNITNLMRSLGYTYCDNSKVYTEYPSLMFGKINSEISVVFDKNDLTFLFLATTELNEILVAHKYIDNVSSFKTLSIPKNCSNLNVGIKYKMPVKSVEAIINKYREL